MTTMNKKEKGDKSPFLGGRRGQLLACMGLTMFLLLQIGCNDDDGASPLKSDSDTPTAESKDQMIVADEQPISVSLADRQGLDRIIAQKLGQVVLVDFWATWCAPCVQQFPHSVELSRKFGPERLAVISVSMDEPDSQDAVLEFLKLKQANFDNLLSRYGVGQEGFEAFEISDGAIPHYKIYDASGKLRLEADNNLEIENFIQKLIDK